MAQERGRHTRYEDSAPNTSAKDTPASEISTMRALPSVEDMRKSLAISLAQGNQPPESQAALTNATRAALTAARARIRTGRPIRGRDELLAMALQNLRESQRPLLRPVINATGVIINTNLGRAPLSARALERALEAAQGYSNLEFDLATGERGSRQSHVRNLLRALSGAEDALVVNNNAAATLVALTALGAGREVIVSRGELVEIGGGFRVPDILAQSGARLVEVGTTNRVRLADYARAITPATALLLSVHPSNFRIVGFTEAPRLTELAELARQHDIPLVRDLGSGAIINTAQFGLAHEETVAESIRAGADIVCFSGDKLLGGPQAGIIVGKRAYIGQLEHHPLMRAIRIDKLCLATLEATLHAYLEGSPVQEIPVWRAIAQSEEKVSERAERWVAELHACGISAEVVQGASTIGGGSLPGETLPTSLCAIPTRKDANQFDPAELARRLRGHEPPVIGRVLRGQALLDPRTVMPEQDSTLIQAVREAVDAMQASQPIS